MKERGLGFTDLLRKFPLLFYPGMITTELLRILQLCYGKSSLECQNK